LSRPFPSRSSSFSGPFVRVNGKIRAREVRVIGDEGKQLGVMSLGQALTLARSQGVDLVEVAATANPPVCRLVDYGKFRYEQAKRDKESKKHQHATRVKELQLSPKIDPHDLGVKIGHAIDFLCEDMKIKVTLKFRGREMAHTEFGFQVIERFLNEIGPYGHPDFTPKLNGRAINVMISPLPRNKRAKHPNEGQPGHVPGQQKQPAGNHQPQESVSAQAHKASKTNEDSKGEPSFSNNPFRDLSAA
jgi:translation initiation factor IF-3